MIYLLKNFFAIIFNLTTINVYFFQDKDFANTSQAACNLIQSQKFVEPLSQRRAEHEKARKLLRDEWNKEVKKMNDAITNLKKAKLLYYQRYTEFEKAKVCFI